MSDGDDNPRTLPSLLRSPSGGKEEDPGAQASRAKQPEANGRLRVETVYGEPYEVGGRRLIPVARITSFGKAKATIGTKQVSGWGGGFTQVTPLALVEDTPEGEHRIAVTDGEAQAIRKMVVGSAVMVLLFELIRRLAGNRRAQAHTSKGAVQ